MVKGRFKESHYLGILYIARVARANGFAVHTILHGHDAESVSSEIVERNPRVVGVSVTGGAWRSSLKLAARLCRLVKAEDSRRLTVLGGLFRRCLQKRYSGDSSKLT